MVRFPKASRIATYVVSEPPLPTARLPVGQDAVVPAALVTYLSWLAAPAVIVKLLLVAVASVPSVAVSV